MSSFRKKLQSLVDSEEELNELEELEEENISLGEPKIEDEIKPEKKEDESIEANKNINTEETNKKSTTNKATDNPKKKKVKVQKTTTKKEDSTEKASSSKENRSYPPIQAIEETKPKTEKKEKTKTKKWPEPEGQLAVDIYETEKDLIIQSAIAGVKPEELDIDAQGDILVIKGKRENPNQEEKNYFTQECYWGLFSKEIVLPVEADASRSEASMVDGILTIKIPKIGKEKKSKITIK